MTPLAERDNLPPHWYVFSKHIAGELIDRGKKKKPRVTAKMLASVIGVGEVQMSYYKKGARGVMTAGQVLAACEYLGEEPALVVGAAHEKYLDEIASSDVQPMAASMDNDDHEAQ